MPLTPGTRLGPYEIRDLLGKGGMGEVYRATDTGLRRQVAIKVLPEDVAADADRLARFQREAEVLASLNHPNIAQIYGLERVGDQTALVLELVEGPTLADRLVQGAVPVNEALSIATQIAEALDSAHEQGIIHRDLKPANIKIRPDGRVKVLDFGLAKAMEPTGATSPTASQSPTLTTPAMTHAGLILGTAAYMSPEQASGEAVDKRSDLWSFGVVVFEMLTGQRLFAGKTVAHVIGAVLQVEPDWRVLPPETPAHLRRLLARCLVKERSLRLRDIGDALADLREPPTLIVSDDSPAREGAFTNRRGTLLRLTGVAFVTAVVTTLVLRATVWPMLPPGPVSRFTIHPPDGYSLRAPFENSGRTFDLSPDGHTLLFNASGSGVIPLFRRDVDRLEVTELPTTSQANVFPAFSSDGRWFAFTDVQAGFSLKKRAMNSGPAVTLYEEEGRLTTAPTWGDNDLIAFGFNGLADSISLVSASGGEARAATTLPAGASRVDHRWPDLLPGGQAMLFTIWNEEGLDGAQTAVEVFETGDQIELFPGSYAKYVPSGHVVFVRGESIWAAPFDLKNLQVTAPAVPVLDDVFILETGIGQFDVANNGTLVYRTMSGGGGWFAPRRLVWVDRDGREEILAAPARPYAYPRISPDGTRVALDVRDQESDIWVWDLDRETLSRVTFGAGIDDYPVWTPNGQQIIYGSNENGSSHNAYRRMANGTGRAEQLTDHRQVRPYAISPDGTRLVVREDVPPSLDVFLVELIGGSEPQPLLTTEFMERNAEISPDGRWLAYESNESGGFEIYVRPFPDVNSGRWQVSTGGGSEPLWSPAGGELFYRALDGRLMSVPVTTDDSFSAGTPSVVVALPYFDGPDPYWGRMYDVSPDGQRFLMLKEGSEETGSGGEFVVVLNWLEELKRLVPAP